MMLYCIEANPTFEAVTEIVQVDLIEDKGVPLDGFCIGLEDSQAQGLDPEGLGNELKETLTALANLDAAQAYIIMWVNYIGARGW
jgi:hypothetical protein